MAAMNLSIPHTKHGWQLGLTWTAGFVDIVGYIVLDHILNANMSGNTVEIAYHLLQHGNAQAMALGWAVLMFVIGLVAYACIHEVCVRRGVSSSAAVTRWFAKRPHNSRNRNAGQVCRVMVALYVLIL